MSVRMTLESAVLDRPLPFWFKVLVLWTCGYERPGAWLLLRPVMVPLVGVGEPLRGLRLRFAQLAGAGNRAFRLASTRRSRVLRRRNTKKRQSLPRALFVILMRSLRRRGWGNLLFAVPPVVDASRHSRRAGASSTLQGVGRLLFTTTTSPIAVADPL